MTLDYAHTRSAVGLATRPTTTDVQDVDSYIETVQLAHSLTSFADLPQVMPAEGVLYQAHEPGGPVVLAVRNDLLPAAYRQGIYGFRLAQCLRLRFADAGSPTSGT